MTFIVGILTFVLVLNALLLILLVLVQLPKKDAGAGMAFGAGTADALFGAGSGNALTKITKYSTIVFLVLALFLGYLHDKVFANSPADAKSFVTKVDQNATQTKIAQPAPVAPTAVSAVPPVNNNLLGNLPPSTNASITK